MSPVVSGAVFVRERLVATLSGLFGFVASTLVCVGLYGLMSFTVARRTAEIGGINPIVALRNE